MLAWQVPYLGWRHFPAELSEFERSHVRTGGSSRYSISQ